MDKYSDNDEFVSDFRSNNPSALNTKLSKKNTEQ